MRRKLSDQKNELTQKQKQELETQQAKMKKEIDDAVKKYNSDIANLKRENEMVQKRFEETKQAQMSNVM